MPSIKDLRTEFVKETASSIPQAAVPLLSDKNIKATIRPMTVKEQREVLKAMEKRDEYLINQAFDAILDHCVVKLDDKPFNNDTLFTQDRIYLLLKIHQLTNGNVAKISHVCPKTGNIVNGIEVDLEKCMKLDFFEGTDIKAVRDITPSIRFILSPITRKMEKEIEKFTKKKDTLTDRRFAAYGAIIDKIEMKNDKSEYEEVSDLTLENKIQLITDLCQPKHLEIFDTYLKSLTFGIKVLFHFKTDDYENEEEEANLLSFFIM